MFHFWANTAIHYRHLCCCVQLFNLCTLVFDFVFYLVFDYCVDPATFLLPRHHQKELRKQALAAAAAGDPGVKDGAHWMVGAAEEMGRKSEKCLKELHQILSALVHSADHILKSTPVQPDKDIT